MIYSTIIRKEPIHKGWSGDRKYCAQDASGKKMLLRISEIAQEDKKKRQFLRMQELAKLQIPMCLPLEFGICDEGVYSLQSWIDGTDAEEAVSRMCPKEQCRYGQEAGAILRKLHSLPAPADAEDWEIRFNKKIDRKIAMYQSCPLRYENDEPFFRYLAENRQLLKNRPQTYQHGDYHIGNMMIDSRGQLTIIDFDRDDHGDPWEEFNRIVWCAQSAPAFASGMVDGYFPEGVPVLFWQLLALYICSNTLSSLPWAIPFGEKEIVTMRNQAAEILQWYENMTNVIPKWYHAQ
jgi:aminoglycoside phosphotransferase (APT) family kinase protein